MLRHDGTRSLGIRGLDPDLGVGVHERYLADPALCVLVQNPGADAGTLQTVQQQIRIRQIRRGVKLLHEEVQLYRRLPERARSTPIVAGYAARRDSCLFFGMPRVIYTS
ncbi:MAG TPA: hypothetical protein VF203_08090 [Burkholderiales bacterium]